MNKDALAALVLAEKGLTLAEKLSNEKEILLRENSFLRQSLLIAIEAMESINISPQARRGLKDIKDYLNA